jgi:Bacteriophage HK97-gp10, putative tail-component
MAGQTSVTIKVISNKIPSLPAALKAQVVEQVKKSTLDVQARAQQVVPVRTGTLRRSIHSIFEQGGLKGICGPSVDYGLAVEMGSRGRAARPYMRPAAELVLPKFADELRRILGGLK